MQGFPRFFVSKSDEIIKSFVAESGENSLEMENGEKAFDTPLIGCSNGADALYLEYRNHIGDFYLTPHDFYSRTFPGDSIRPEELAVISWIIPSTRKTRDE